MDPLRRVTPAQKYALTAKLRRSATPIERHAWSLLRQRGVLGLKFRRQHILRGFIVDFYCSAERLVLELENDVHDGPDQRAYDAARAEVLKAAGFHVIRVPNRQVTRVRLEAVLRGALTLRSSPPVPLSAYAERGNYAHRGERA